jgi:hypothetical protein
LSSLNGEVVVVVVVHRISKRRSDPKTVGGGGVEATGGVAVQVGRRGGIGVIVAVQMGRCMRKCRRRH